MITHTFPNELDDFDLAQGRQRIRELFAEWQADATIV